MERERGPNVRSGVREVECARGRDELSSGHGLVSTSLTINGTSLVDLLSPSLLDGEVLVDARGRVPS